MALRLQQVILMEMDWMILVVVDLLIQRSAFYCNNTMENLFKKDLYSRDR